MAWLLESRAENTRSTGAAGVEGLKTCGRVYIIGNGG